MIFSRLLKGKKINASAVIVAACFCFVLGSVVMYQIPLGTVASQLLGLFLLVLMVMAVAVMVAAIVIVLKKLFKKY